MVALIDTNIIIDFLITREPYCKNASTILALCADNDNSINGYIALHSLSNIWYILRKIPDDIRRNWLINICQILNIAVTDHESIIDALKLKNFRDFEDCLQFMCAKYVMADYIITRNISDFSQSDIPAISPDDFLLKFNL